MPLSSIPRLLALLALLLLAAPLWAAELTGKVVAVHDGDTMTRAIALCGGLTGGGLPG